MIVWHHGKRLRIPDHVVKGGMFRVPGDTDDQLVHARDLKIHRFACEHCCSVSYFTDEPFEANIPSNDKLRAERAEESARDWKKRHDEMVARAAELQGRAEAADREREEDHACMVEKNALLQGSFEAVRDMTIAALEEAISLVHKRPFDVEKKLVELRDSLKPIVKVDP